MLNGAMLRKADAEEMRSAIYGYTWTEALPALRARAPEHAGTLERILAAFGIADPDPEGERARLRQQLDAVLSAPSAYRDAIVELTSALARPHVRSPERTAALRTDLIAHVRDKALPALSAADGLALLYTVRKAGMDALEPERLRREALVPRVPGWFDPGGELVDLSPADALALFQRHGLCTGLDVDGFAALCQAEIEDDEDRADEHISSDIAFGALAAYYGAQDAAPRAAQDRCFLLSDKDDNTRRVAVRATLSSWIGQAIPLSVDNDADNLLSYAADVLMLRNAHAQREDAPRLFYLEAVREKTDELVRLVLLRTVGEAEKLALPWQHGFPVAPDSDAARNGIFRTGDPPEAFAEHARGCTVCQAALARSAQKGELPEAYAPLLRSRTLS
jgi:hypothetical protein